MASIVFGVLSMTNTGPGRWECRVTGKLSGLRPEVAMATGSTPREAQRKAEAAVAQRIRARQKAKKTRKPRPDGKVGN